MHHLLRHPRLILKRLLNGFRKSKNTIRGASYNGQTGQNVGSPGGAALQSTVPDGVHGEASGGYHWRFWPKRVTVPLKLLQRSGRCPNDTKAGAGSPWK